VRKIAKILATLVRSGKFGPISVKLIADLAGDIQKTFNRSGPEN
jgi:hypothetical protein